MVPVRTTVEISEGVKVDLLFTPRIALYQDKVKPLPETPGGASVLAVMERYADIMYFAALNAWELDGYGTEEDFPHKRGDVHGWMQADREGFGKAMGFAVRAITGKTIREIQAEEEAKRKAKEKEDAAGKEEGAEPIKKKRMSFFSRHTDQ